MKPLPLNTRLNVINDAIALFDSHCIACEIGLCSLFEMCIEKYDDTYSKIYKYDYDYIPGLIPEFVRPKDASIAAWWWNKNKEGMERRLEFLYEMKAEIEHKIFMRNSWITVGILSAVVLIIQLIILL